MKTIKLRSLFENLEEAHQTGECSIDDAGEIDPSKQKPVASPDEALKDKWKKMVADEDKITVTTWILKAEDLRMIIKGIEAIMNHDPQAAPANDPDATVQKDGYPGPRIDLILKGRGKDFKNVPLALLKKCLPSRIQNYEKGKDINQLNEGIHHLHKEYRLFEANNHIVAIFEDNSRLVFEVHYHDKHGEDREKWRRRAFSRWKSCANEIHKESETLNEAGNPMTKSWRQCFEEALKHPKLQEFIRDPEKHKRIYPMMDSVNFTPRI